MKRQIKLFDPIIDNNVSDILNKILKSKFWADGSGNNQVKFFEEKFQKIIKIKSLIFLSLIHISEPTRLRRISYAVFCLKKKTNKQIKVQIQTSK